MPVNVESDGPDLGWWRWNGVEDAEGQQGDGGWPSTETDRADCSNEKDFGRQRSQTAAAAEAELGRGHQQIVRRADHGRGSEAVREFGGELGEGEQGGAKQSEPNAILLEVSYFCCRLSYVFINSVRKTTKWYKHAGQKHFIHKNLPISLFYIFY